MKVYFVRHGESEGNVMRVAQAPAVPLTLNGLKQAGKLASRFAKEHIDVILASPAQRTRQTAQMISEVVGKDIQFSDLLLEKRNPSEVLGMQHDALEFTKVHDLVRSHEDDPTYHYSDEENVFDLRERMSKALEYIEKYEGTAKEIIVVSHGFAIRMMFGLMLFPKTFSVYEFRRTCRNMTMSNTGVTFCEYTKEDGWLLHSYNDAAHLLE